MTRCDASRFTASQISDLYKPTLNADLGIRCRNADREACALHNSGHEGSLNREVRPTALLDIELDAADLLKNLGLRAKEGLWLNGSQASGSQRDNVIAAGQPDTTSV